MTNGGFTALHLSVSHPLPVFLKGSGLIYIFSANKSHRKDENNKNCLTNGNSPLANAIFTLI